MMIILAMKFVAMLCMLNFSIKIHTCKHFFLLGNICCRAGLKETFLKNEDSFVKARAYPCERKNKQYEF